MFNVFATALPYFRVLQTIATETETVAVRANRCLTAATFTEIDATKSREKTSEKTVCIRCVGGNAMLSSGPITVVALCIAAMYSYIFGEMPIRLGYDMGCRVEYHKAGAV